MLGFEKFFNSKKNSPAEDEKSLGDGLSSSEKAPQNYERLEENQVWTTEERRIRIECLDPVQVYEYGSSGGTRFYEDLTALKKELQENHFLLEEKKQGTTEQSSDIQYVGATPVRQTGTTVSSLEPGLKVVVKDAESGKTENPAERAAYDNLNYEIESNIQELERLKDEMDMLLGQGSEFLVDNEEGQKTLDTLISEIETFFRDEVNARITQDEELDARVGQQGIQSQTVAEKRENAAQFSRFVEQAGHYVRVIKEAVEKAKQAPRKKADVVSLDAHPNFSPKKARVESSQEPVKETQKKKENILEQLKPERKGLEVLMQKHEAELALRKQTGWITLEEERQIIRALDESDAIIRKTLLDLTEKEVSVTDARRELKYMEDNLPMVRLFSEQRQNLEVLRFHDEGEEFLEVLEQALIAAMQDYYRELSKEKLAGEMKDEHWIKNVLPELEKKALQSLQRISPNVELNKSALQALLSEIAKKVK